VEVAVQLDWIALFKRYVGDDVRTPYFVAVERLSRVQANYELFTYAVLLTVIFGVIGVASLSPGLPHGDTLVVSVYAFIVAGSAVAFGITKSPIAGAVCASAPVGVLLYFVIFGFHPDSATGDKLVQIVILLLWLRYSWRVVKIGRAYPTLPAAHTDKTEP
jgi:hypothetical protein